MGSVEPQASAGTKPVSAGLIVANAHDEMTGPNVIVVRTALHRVTRARLAAEGELWRERLAPFKRPLVAVLLGGNNGRYRLDADAGGKLAADLAAMARRDGVGIVVTPSRRTDPAVTALMRQALEPVGGWVWDMTGDNPYFGMLALADTVIVTQDSVSMISEASATAAPVMFAPLPGKARRHELFLGIMRDAGDGWVAGVSTGAGADFAAGVPDARRWREGCAQGAAEGEGGGGASGGG